ncbi:hypothetical protein GCM10007924_05140 [Sneathiella chinensis]|uniref:Uncharacterized protein n=2 Tax=Sneathiella chinensis TaxID=349750 RepID=A0ABQ5U0P2_9PROT|nr:hypothetical protein GCM10007924_05140 [Sneathiella chinensis]
MIPPEIHRSPLAAPLPEAQPFRPDERRTQASDIQTGVNNDRKRIAFARDNDTNPRETASAASPRSSDRAARPSGFTALDFGQSSAAFLTQQLAQQENPNNLHTGDAEPMAPENIYRDVTNAYRATHGLTATILGFQGFRERVA